MEGGLIAWRSCIRRAGPGPDRLRPFLHGELRADPRARTLRYLRLEGRERSAAHVQAQAGFSRDDARPARQDGKLGARRRFYTASITRWSSRRRRRTPWRNASAVFPTRCRPMSLRRPANAGCRPSSLPATPRRSSKPWRRRAGQGLSAPDRSRKYRAAEELRADQRGRVARRTRSTGNPHGGRRDLQAMAERLVFPHRPSGQRAAGAAARWSRRDGVRLGDRRHRRQGRGADDRGDHRAPAEARPRSADRVILPGRYRGDLDRLAAHFGVPFVRGPDEIADLPVFLGRAGEPPDLSAGTTCASSPRSSMRRRCRSRRLLAGRARLRLPAPTSSTSAACRKRRFRISAKPCATLKGRGLAVSVDSADLDELETGAAAGADYLLSLDENTLRSPSTRRDAGADPVRSPAISIRSAAPSTRAASCRASPSSPIRCSIRSISASPPRSAASSRRAGAGRRSRC